MIPLVRLLENNTRRHQEYAPEADSDTVVVEAPVRRTSIEPESNVESGGEN